MGAVGGGPGLQGLLPPLLALKDYFESDTNDRLVLVSRALDLDPLLQRLDRRRGRGRRGYSLRMMLQAVIAAWVYNLNSMAELRRELLRNGSLRILVGIRSVGEVPSEDALSRFFARLAKLGEEVDKLHARRDRPDPGAEPRGGQACGHRLNRDRGRRRAV